MRSLFILAIKALAIAALISFSPSAYCQKGAVVRGIAKKLVKKGAKEAASEAVEKQAREEIFAYGGRKIGENYVENAVGKQAARTVVRKGLSKEIEEKGFKSFKQLGLAKSRSMIPSSHSAARLTQCQGRTVGYSSQVSSLMRMVSKFLSGAVEVGKRNKGKDALKALESSDPQLYKSFKPAIDKNFAGQNFQGKFVYRKKLNGDVVIRNEEATAINTNITIRKDGKVLANSGCTPNSKSSAPNYFLDFPKPNTEFIVDKSTKFRTDKLGRTVFAEADRTHPMAIKDKLGDERREFVQKYKNGRGKNIDDAGHILQKNEGGIDEVINLVPMDRKWQRSGGLWREIEKREEVEIKKARMSGAKSIISRRELIYKGNSGRPSAIKFSTIIDGKSVVSEKLFCP